MISDTCIAALYLSSNDLIITLSLGHIQVKFLSHFIYFSIVYISCSSVNIYFSVVSCFCLYIAVIFDLYTFVLVWTLGINL